MNKNLTDHMTQYEKSVYTYGISNYYFIVQGMGAITLNQFADEIEKVYDKNNPNTAEVCRIFRKFSDMNER